MSECLIYFAKIGMFHYTKSTPPFLEKSKIFLNLESDKGPKLICLHIYDKTWVLQYYMSNTYIT